MNYLHSTQHTAHSRAQQTSWKASTFSCVRHLIPGPSPRSSSRLDCSTGVSVPSCLMRSKFHFHPQSLKMQTNAPGTIQSLHDCQTLNTCKQPNPTSSLASQYPSSRITSSCRALNTTSLARGKCRMISAREAGHSHQRIAQHGGAYCWFLAQPEDCSGGC
jgi:hypothetical protein